MDCIKAHIEKYYSEKRRIHTYGVCETSKKLALIYKVDEKKAEIAALFHDYFRGVKESVLNNYVRELGLSEKYLNNCNLAHGKIAAIIMKRDYNIKDEDILNAVSYHTTGRPNMSKLEKVIYLADAIEPNRVYPGVEEIRKLAFEDLDRACFESMCKSIEFIKSQGVFLDEDTIAARDYLSKELEKETKNEQ